MDRLDGGKSQRSGGAAAFGRPWGPLGPTACQTKEQGPGPLAPGPALSGRIASRRRPPPLRPPPAPKRRRKSPAFQPVQPRSVPHPKQGDSDRKPVSQGHGTGNAVRKGHGNGSIPQAKPLPMPYGQRRLHPPRRGLRPQAARARWCATIAARAGPPPAQGRRARSTRGLASGREIRYTD